MQTHDSTRPASVYWPDGGPTGPFQFDDAPHLAQFLHDLLVRYERARGRTTDVVARAIAINAAAFDVRGQTLPPPLRPVLRDWVAGGPVPEHQGSRRDWHGGAA